MFVKLLKSKLHRARVTDTKLNYPGSIAIDSDLMESVGLLRYESVLVADLNNGNRLDTYVIPAQAGSGDIVIMGAAARQIRPKDIVIILSFGFYSPQEAEKHEPKIVVLDENNKIKTAD